MHFSSLHYLNFIKKIWQVKLKFGQVSFFVTCPNGQVSKKVNVEPWLVPTQLLAGYETFVKKIFQKLIRLLH